MGQYKASFLPALRCGTSTIATAMAENPCLGQAKNTPCLTPHLTLGRALVSLCFGIDRGGAYNIISSFDKERIK